MKLSTFEIRNREYIVKINNSQTKVWHRDFFIDGESLADRLGLNYWNRTSPFETFRWELVLEQFLGKVSSSNQFGTGRLVLYRCLCTCDYCGVISCILQKKGPVIRWTNIREEQDDLLSKESFQSLPETFYFDFSDYCKEFLKVTEVSIKSHY